MRDTVAKEKKKYTVTQQEQHGRRTLVERLAVQVDAAHLKGLLENGLDLHFRARTENGNVRDHALRPFYPNDIISSVHRRTGSVVLVARPRSLARAGWSVKERGQGS